jgi:hypothetical protein
MPIEYRSLPHPSSRDAGCARRRDPIELAASPISGGNAPGPHRRCGPLPSAALTNYTINATLLRPALQFDIQKDFAPVAIVATVPLLLLVRPSVPATDLRQFVAHATANPENSPTPPDALQDRPV